MKKNQIKDHQKFLIEQLKDPEVAVEYLNNALSEKDNAMFLLALKNVVEAHGVSKIARKSKLNRENMYRILSASGNPQLSSIMSLINSLGLSFSIRPAF
ncbi:MAG: putative addiction module antidote protein [Candidatus Wallbacteria bacterium]